MSIKLLPASVGPVDLSQASDVSTSLTPLTPTAISARAGQTGLVPVDTFAWSSSTRRSESNLIYGTPVEDSQSDETGSAGGEYVSGWWSRPLESTAAASYLFYAAGPASWSGQFIDVYA
jgi:hypothetical protein